MRNKKYVLIDKKSIFIDERVEIGENVIIYENNRIEGDSVIGDNVTIYPNCFIVNSIIGKGSKIYTSVIENCYIGDRNIIRPFTYLKKLSTEAGLVLPKTEEKASVKSKNMREML